MSYDVTVEMVRPQLIASVRAHVPINGIARAWKPALDQVWAFLRANRALEPGHNLFLYHHPDHREAAMDIDFGVEVQHRFDPAGNVRCVETPAGEVAYALHVGPYDRLRGAHDAVHAWCAANKRPIGRASWETYGDWNDDPAKLETTVSYLLA
jgi:effector-binding domain-containing protein